MWALARHEDRLTEACNKIAILLTANTPFYPVYLWYILGRTGWPCLLLTALSLPFFAATIFIAKRHSLAGRIWLCFFASLNTGWVTWLLGPQSGTALFFLPCLVLSVQAFRATEPLPRAILTALPFILYAGLVRAPHAPIAYTASADASMFTLNAISVAALSVVLPYLLGAARGEG
jgi:hypothetical protein